MRTAVSAVLLVSLFGCMRPPSQEPPAPIQAPVSSAPAMPVNDPTDDVSFRGTLDAAGISVYMEGTHRLYPDDGDMVVLLQSDEVNLDAYVGERVLVTGDARPTVELGGTLVVVHRIELLLPLPDVSSSSAMEDSSSSMLLEPVESSSESSVASLGSVAASSVARVSAASSVASAHASSVPSDTRKDNIDLMAKDTVDAANFTQQYCSGHVGFCIPVHRNWYYYSFGATTSYLWHVEVGAQEIENLNDGPLIVNLVSGDLGGMTDGEVIVSGDFVVGYRAWTNNRHMEITAPAALRAAVEFMTANVVVYQQSAASPQ